MQQVTTLNRPGAFPLGIARYGALWEFQAECLEVLGKGHDVMARLEITSTAPGGMTWAQLCTAGIDYARPLSMALRRLDELLEQFVPGLARMDARCMPDFVFGDPVEQVVITLIIVHKDRVGIADLDLLAIGATIMSPGMGDKIAFDHLPLSGDPVGSVQAFVQSNGLG